MRLWAPLAAFGALLPLVALAHAARPQGAVWQADVRVQALEISSLRGQLTAASSGAARQLTARVVITSDNDDDARAVRLHVLLPIGAGVLRLTSGCQASPSAVATLTGRVTCELGDLPVRGLREVSITTTGPASGEARFAAFVYSDTPDPVPSNNYLERAAP